MKVSDFKTEEQLRKMNVADIKKHVREFNDHFSLKGYSKLKKDQLISVILTAQTRIKNAVPKAEPQEPKVKGNEKKKERVIKEYKRVLALLGSFKIKNMDDDKKERALTALEEQKDKVVAVKAFTPELEKLYKRQEKRFMS